MELWIGHGSMVDGWRSGENKFSWATVARVNNQGRRVMNDVMQIERISCWEKDRRGRNDEKPADHKSFLKIHRYGKSDETATGCRDCCLSIGV